MLTEAPPRKSDRSQFVESDRIRTLELPADPELPTIANSIESRMQAGIAADVRRVSAEFLAAACRFYQVRGCGFRVLAARPLRVREIWTSERFGDYDPETQLIRVWMRTAIRKEITSYGTFLSTLCHEFCHHLDFERFGFRDSWHTRGFYERAAALYHHARATAPKKLVWVAAGGGRYRIDWPRTNRPGQTWAGPEPSQRCQVKGKDFRRIALTPAGVEEGSHMGRPDYRGHLEGALRTAWNNRLEKNAQSKNKPPAPRGQALVKRAFDEN